MIRPLHFILLATISCICASCSVNSNPSKPVNKVSSDPPFYNSKIDQCTLSNGDKLINFSSNSFMSCETWREFGKPIKELVADYPAGLVSPKLYDLKAWRENENKKDDEASQKSQKDLEDWAIRSHEAEKQQQDKCWDQLEQRGYGDPDCYQSY